MEINHEAKKDLLRDISKGVSDLGYSHKRQALKGGDLMLVGTDYTRFFKLVHYITTDDLYVLTTARRPGVVFQGTKEEVVQWVNSELIHRYGNYPTYTDA